MKYKARLQNIKSKVSQNKDYQIGGVRFDEKTYKKIVEVSEEFKISKQELIRTIVVDFFIQD